MDDRRVTVRLDANGEVAGVDVEGQLDPDDFVEETPGKPVPSPAEDGPRSLRFWATE